METGCVHYWLMEPNIVPTSQGVCKKCGKVRTFYNYFPGGIPTGYVPDSLKTGKIKKPRIKKGEQNNDGV